MLPNKNDFFKDHHISEEEFEKSGYEWDEMMKIFLDYQREMKDLKILAHFIEECMIDVKKAHSIKKRIKDPSHLIRKIIMRKLEKGETITLADYKKKITDLIGIRVLHLFKEDWKPIHDDILSKWIMKEQPVANVCEGDRSELIEKFKSQGLEILKHKYGYRSVHYQILLVHNKKEITAEIQVRTLFEEAWSEIDHRMRYPYNLNDKLVSEYLVIFNRLAGSADEMGSFIKMLKKGHDRYYSDKKILIGKIINEIKNSNLSQAQIDDLISRIENVGPHKENNTLGATAIPNELTGYEGRKSFDDEYAGNIDELMKLEKEMNTYGK